MNIKVDSFPRTWRPTAMNLKTDNICVQCKILFILKDICIFSKYKIEQE